MASTSAPFGFRPSFHNSGQMRPKAYAVTSGYAASIFAGDPVKIAADGTVQLGTSDGTRSGTVDGIKLLGIAAGFEWLDSTGKPTISPFWTGSTAVYQTAAATILLGFLISTAQAEQKPTIQNNCHYETIRVIDGKLYQYTICPQEGYSIGIPVSGDFVNVPYSATKVRVLPNGKIELY